MHPNLDRIIYLTVDLQFSIIVTLRYHCGNASPYYGEQQNNVNLNLTPTFDFLI